MPPFDERSRHQFSSFSRPDGPGRSLGLLSTENASTSPLPVSGRDGLPGPETDKTTILPVLPPPLLPAPVPTNQLSFQQNPVITRTLPRTLPETTGAAGERVPFVIKGEGREAPVISPIPHHRRRLYVTLAGILSLVVITGFTLLAVSPLGHDLSQVAGVPPGIKMINSLGNSQDLTAHATATAVYDQSIDGFDPNAAYGQTFTNGSSSLSWPVGQCTYWANKRYQQLTGFWVQWTGNADQWYAGAKTAGWDVSTIPPIGKPSIIVLMPGIQGAGGYGHVAVVESIVGVSSTTPTPSTTPGATPGPTPTPVPASAITTVVTSNMNWWTNGGGWDIESYVDFNIGYGVYFIWHT